MDRFKAEELEMIKWALRNAPWDYDHLYDDALLLSCAIDRWLDRKESL